MITPKKQQQRNQQQREQQEQQLTAGQGTTQVMSVVEPPDRRRKNIVVNSYHCRNEVDTVQYVISKYGYRETRNQTEGNILYYGLALRDNDVELIKMKRALINRYPLMDHFAKKNIFCVIISRLQRFFPIDYRFMPDSFLLPDEIKDLEQHMRHFPNQCFICKPSRGRGGEGISLIKKFHDLPRNANHSEFLVQRYVENPLLVASKKFDIRLYIVIKGVDPIEAYLFEEGLARFCTANYKKPDSMNLRNLYMHLTNYSLNKNSDKFKKADASFMNGGDNASKQLLTNVYKKLASRGRDIRHIKRQIEELAAKTVIALEPYLKNAYHCFVSADHTNPRCFQILGLDILIDENWFVWLMEVNANPSLNVYNDKVLPNGDIEQTLSELDKYVKTTLLADTLALVSTASVFNKQAGRDTQREERKGGQQTQQQQQQQEPPVNTRPAQQGMLKLILPNPERNYDELYLYSQAETIFEVLAGQKNYDFITSNQFQRLAKFENMTNSHISKAHYDIIYKNVVRRSENTQMDLNCFFEALEDIAQRLYSSRRDVYENLSQLILNVFQQL